MENIKKVIAVAILFLLIAAPGYADSPNQSLPRTSARIVGGDEAESGDWPWMAALVDAYNSDNYSAKFCGASLIDSKWVVTAAHCITSMYYWGEYMAPGDVEVVLGVYDLKHDSGKRVRVKRIIPHPLHDLWAETSDSDIALLELAEEVSYPTLPLVSEDSSLEGIEAVAIGWGLTNPQGSVARFPYKLQQVSVPIISNEECNESYNQTGGYYNDSITDTMMCAGEDEGGKDTCQGDSGGPLVIQDGDAWKLAGITSWGVGCGEAGFYGIYARVSKLLDFIDKNLAMDYFACADANGDGLVNRKDRTKKYNDLDAEFEDWILECWYSETDCGDVNGDGNINRADIIRKNSDLNQEFKDWKRECWVPEMSWY